MKKIFMLDKLAFYWFSAFLLAAVILSFSHFQSESNDSKYYTDLVVRYHQSDLSHMLTPKWGENFWGFDRDGYMFDQFPGQLLMGIALTKIGVPAEQSLHVLGMFFQICSFLILAKLVAGLSNQENAHFVLLVMLLTPLSFSYNIRANHELGIMFFSFFSLYAGWKLVNTWKWSIAVVFSSTFLLMIKGPFFVFGPILFWLGFYFSEKSKKSNLYFIFAQLLALLFVALTAVGFDYLFIHITGQSFLKEFWHIQINQRALLEIKKHTLLIQKILNFVYYFNHYLAYSLPWSLILVVALFLKNKFRTWCSFLLLPQSLILLSASLVFCLLFSLSDRIAGRYVFPGYYLFSAWIGIGLLGLDQKYSLFILSQKERLQVLIPLLWFISFIVHFI